MDKTGTKKMCFAPIDAKEYPVITLDYRYAGRTAEEETLCLDAVLEYLQGIAELQDKLRAKYAPLFEGLETIPAGDQKSIWAAQDKWHENHPEYSKVDHLYYT